MFVFNFGSFKWTDQTETIENLNDVVALAQSDNHLNKVVVWSHDYNGMLKFHIYVMDKGIANIVTAHENNWSTSS